MTDEAGASLEAKIEQGWRIRQTHFPANTIIFDYPVNTGLVSLTGPACALNCAHCNAHYLAHMIPADRALDKIPGAPSYLISGGCDRMGKVPVTAHLDVARRLAEHAGLNWHVGFIDEDEMDAIAPYVHTISFDFVGDDATIREVYGLDHTVDDYIRTYEALSRRFRVVPHLTIGLRGGQLGHERPALDILRGLPPFDTLVFLVLIPTEGTRYADRTPPAVEAALEIILEGRRLFPDRIISLGCMRPHGEYRARLDALAVRAGVNRIVSPAREAVRVAEVLGLSVEKRMECCIF